MRQNIKRRIRNLHKKRKVKSFSKQLETLVSQKKIKEAKKLLQEYYKLLDKAAKTGVIHRNKAARKKSRIAQKINNLKHKA